MDLGGSITALATKLHSGLHGLKSSCDREDLVQEVYLKAITKLHQFRGESTLKTWVVAVGRNTLLRMAKQAARRPRSVGDLDPLVNSDPGRRLVLRSSTKDLLAWLRANPSEVESGWQVLNLLLWTHGNYDYVALAMCLHTRRPWTTERVRRVIRRIRQTPRGLVLCEALGLLITTDGEK